MAGAPPNGHPDAPALVHERAGRCLDRVVEIGVFEHDRTGGPNAPPRTVMAVAAPGVRASPVRSKAAAPLARAAVHPGTRVAVGR
jgi:hypothetical protein